MEYERVSMAQLVEIERLIKEGHSNRQIAKALRCRRLRIADIRKNILTAEVLSRAQTPEAKLPPGWALQIDWGSVEKDIREGYQLKRIWEEVAEGRTSHSNFFKYVKTRFALLLEQTVTLREFRAGEHCEVDYAGDKICWINPRTGEIHEAHVFLGILCFSQKIFACAHENEKKPNWIDAHRRMFEFYGGSARVLVPDCLKNGVIKAHLYDPDLNPDYVELAAHYRVAIVPARSKHPRDKALIENAVGIVMRYFRFSYRRRTFTSLTEVNQALTEVIAKINSKTHTRFRTSRNERFNTLEKTALQSLPLEPYSMSEWKTPTLHPDCTVLVDGNFYSAPHVHRGKELRVKITASLVEIFLDLERIALHARVRGKVGERVIKNEHLPENSRAYRESTPQLLLAQAKFSHPELHKLIDELFQQDTLANMRRAQGLTRKAFALIQRHSREAASPWIEVACAHMRRFGRVRVQVFEDIIKTEMKRIKVPRDDRTITRQSGNPMVRGLGTYLPEGVSNQVPNQLNLL
jgi:transposase